MKLTKEFIELQGYILKECHVGQYHCFYYHNDLTNNLFIIIWDEQNCGINITKNNLNQDDKERTTIYQGDINHSITFMYLMLLCEETPYNGIIFDIEFINNFTKIKYPYEELEFYLICDSVLSTVIALEMYEKCESIIKFRKNYINNKGWNYIDINETILNHSN